MYKLSERAAEDFIEIYDYTFMKFGEVQADHYTQALEAFLETLASMPGIGRDYSAIPGVMRIEFQRHTIFYTVRDIDILIARILHQQMNHAQHFL
ncbi:type II toxin-antitoxin system RelE/ParE family toxin [Xenorhabdus sp. Flor]|uniref:type II toxin-antitoxin system RelE/ParE family toxin n=1 Tax=Xenorhabdus cabanillasii TaxID=351673 RepID=UPI0019AA6D89|nr:type II toxin-antitoxin system RelE/ParE family toxin [Xenorhabdus sp. Flor]MBD2814547.1 type II toxin-antitoxin system RelE/ParE family toxin [Xenorhabdus sp. Flor]